MIDAPECSRDKVFSLYKLKLRRGAGFTGQAFFDQFSQKGPLSPESLPRLYFTQLLQTLFFAGNILLI